MILVDTSVIADILTKDREWFEWSSEQLEVWGDKGPVCYNEMVFAELAVKFDTQKELEHRLSAFTHLPMPLNAAFQAGKAYEKYRPVVEKKRGPFRTSSLAPMPTWRTSRCSRAIRGVSEVSFHRSG